MTEYIVTERDGKFYVLQIFSPTHFIEHGPYKNRKSAVGRISDLKKKEVHGNFDPPFDPKDEALKLAASSEYGKSKPFKLDEQAFMNAVRPRGVYPAVSKHAYQR